MDCKGKIVVITGASSGIGRQAAVEFAKRGATTIALARRADRLERLEDELKKIGIQCMVRVCDVSDRKQVDSTADAILERFGHIDVLVNNAGFAVYGAVSDMDTGDIEAQMATNYLGMVYCVKAFLPSMLKRSSGHIVNVASVAASVSVPGIVPYAATKFAMLGFSEGLKHELGGTGVGITVVSPIMVRTEFCTTPSLKSSSARTSLSAETVAKAIVGAADSPRLEVIVPWGVRVVVWLKTTLPYLINPLIGRYFGKHLRAARQLK